MLQSYSNPKAVVPKIHQHNGNQECVILQIRNSLFFFPQIRFIKAFTSFAYTLQETLGWYGPVPSQQRSSTPNSVITVLEIILTYIIKTC